MQNVPLGEFHRQRVPFPFVIVADKMQETVHGEMGGMMGKRLALAPSLARDGLKGKNDIA